MSIQINYVIYVILEFNTIFTADVKNYRYFDNATLLGQWYRFIIILILNQGSKSVFFFIPQIFCQ